MKRPVKYSDLPAVFTPEILQFILELEKEGGKEWDDIYEQLSPEQFIQYANANASQQEQETVRKKNGMSQEEIDQETRSSRAWASTRWNDDPDIFHEFELIERYKRGELDWPEDDTNSCHARVRMHAAWQKTGEQFFFFDKASPFSNSYPCSLIIDEKKFCSVLHYMAYRKADFFIDRPAIDRLINMTDQQMICTELRSIHHYHRDTWNLIRGDALRLALKMKFEQNEDLQQLLLNTSGKTLVFLDVNDSRWGIQNLAEYASKNTRSEWKGRNFLGELLTETRVELAGHY